jgi:hypothetical protein
MGRSHPDVGQYVCGPVLRRLSLRSSFSSTAVPSAGQITIGTGLFIVADIPENLNNSQATQGRIHVASIPLERVERACRSGPAPTWSWRAEPAIASQVFRLWSNPDGELADRADAENFDNSQAALGRINVDYSMQFVKYGHSLATDRKSEPARP